MAMHQVIDAAYPPETLPPGVVGVLGYIGGRMADHTWTLEQWLPFASVRQFPVWVADTGAPSGSEGWNAVDAAHRLGWSAKMDAPDTRLIICDMEMSTDRVWYAGWAAAVTRGGFVPVAYGSLSTVLQVAAADVLAAEWDDLAAIPAGQTIHGKQDRANVPFAGTLIDYCVIDDWFYEKGGVGRRH